jgi:N-acetylmuramic acid 6-phosphate etherase
MGKCDLLGVHLTLKMLLNMHSTLLMGLMNRYQSNIMTFVRPSNNKLIDRCVRYAQLLLREKGVEVDYKDLVNDCFNFMDENQIKEVEEIESFLCQKS